MILYHQIAQVVLLMQVLASALITRVYCTTELHFCTVAELDRLHNLLDNSKLCCAVETCVGMAAKSSMLMLMAFMNATADQQ